MEANIQPLSVLKAGVRLWVEGKGGYVEKAYIHSFTKRRIEAAHQVHTDDFPVNNDLYTHAKWIASVTTPEIVSR